MLCYMSLSTICVLKTLIRKRNSESYVYCCTTMISCQIHIAGNNKTYLGFHEKFPKILPDINKLYVIDIL